MIYNTKTDKTLKPLKRKIYQFSSLVFIFLGVCGYGQNSHNNTPHNNSPVGIAEPTFKTPNVASIDKYTDMTIGNNTGSANITYPIYTISEGDIEFDVYLKYNTTGIKVEEYASDVGLGWSLVYGGQISRNINGRPDDIGGIIYNNLNPNIEFNQECNNLYQIDFEPDMFSFSFGKFSGKFQYSKIDNKFVSLTENNIKIEPVFENSKLIKFILTTPDGIKYYFGKNKDNTRIATGSECDYELDITYPASPPSQVAEILS